MHFLEIQYRIFSCFTAKQIVDPVKTEQDAWNKVQMEEEARKRKLKFAAGLRHSKFGAML